MKLGLTVATETPAGERHVPADQASYAGLRPGDTLDERFLIKETIRRGGMATVFKAEDLHNHRQPVAIKVPHEMYASGLGAWSRATREEEIGSRLNHPRILRFVPVPGRQRGAYVVTEYLRGETLADRLARAWPLHEQDALAVARGVCEAIEYLHENGVVHYDLKPGNVMLCDDGSIRLLDFGLAQPIEDRRFSLSGAPPAMGTTDYIAPEQIQRKRGRPSADIYSLGAMLYEMLTGSAPFPGDDPFVIGSQRLTGDPIAPRKLNPSLSPQAEEIILHAMQRAPADRYRTAAAMKADLDAPEQVRVTGLCDRLQPSTRWRRARLKARWIVLTCVLPVAVQALLYFLIWFHYSYKR
jgi:serine/threonine-protein kinase